MGGCVEVRDSNRGGGKGERRTQPPHLPTPRRLPGCTAPPGRSPSWLLHASTCSVRRWVGGWGGVFLGRSLVAQGGAVSGLPDGADLLQAACRCVPQSPWQPPSPPAGPLQYQRNYFVSWDSVFVPADILLSSLGVGPSPGVDHAWQIAAFLDTWQKGGWGEGVVRAGPWVQCWAGAAAQQWQKMTHTPHPSPTLHPFPCRPERRQVQPAGPGARASGRLGQPSPQVRQPPTGQPTACPALQSTLNHSRPAPRPPAAAPTPPS